jgi:hypothetical protein
MDGQTIVVDVDGVGEVEFPAGMSEADIDAAIRSFHPDIEDYTVDEKSVNRQRRLKELKDLMHESPISPLGLMGPGGAAAGKAAPAIVRGLRSVAGRLWGGAAKSGSDDVAEQVLSRGAGRLTARNSQRLADEAAAGSSPAREASTILDAAGKPAREATAAVSSPLQRAADVHAAASRGGKPSIGGRLVDAAGILGAVPSGGASLALNAARGAARPGVRAAVAQLLYSGAPKTPEMARAAALAALMESGLADPSASHGSGR